MGWVQLQEKLSHPYKFTHKKLQIKMEETFFCDGFLKGGERENFQNFQEFFQNFSTIFSLFFNFFSPSFSSYFSQKMRGYLQGRKERGRLCVVYHGTLHIASHFCHLIRLFCLFSSFWSKICAAVWRHFRAPFSSKFIFLERSGCLVSIGPNLKRFGAMVVNILCLEGRLCSAENSVMFFH